MRLINSSTAYEAVFGTLYALGDPGVDGDDVFGLYESREPPRARDGIDRNRLRRVDLRIESGRGNER
ncbi:hypothetical protein FCE95_05070 [Luteimonas gilva]|uniref:Uncharacterized protein n=1 Tax=Luteimonas gilva TaxID=2572684 RepID=A0A4U5JUT0_9GAMM|nr:hypothetical protein FCE95_05070 [Luteimonas gilva]